MHFEFGLDVREDIIPSQARINTQHASCNMHHATCDLQHALPQSHFVVKATDIMLMMKKKTPHSFDRLAYLESPPGFRGRIKMEQVFSNGRARSAQTPKMFAKRRLQDVRKKTAPRKRVFSVPCPSLGI